MQLHVELNISLKLRLHKPQFNNTSASACLLCLLSCALKLMVQGEHSKPLKHYNHPPLHTHTQDHHNINILDDYYTILAVAYLDCQKQWLSVTASSSIFNEHLISTVLVSLPLSFFWLIL